MHLAFATSEESNYFIATLAYNFLPFATLDRQPDGVALHLLGRITHVDAFDIYAKIHKVVITLTSGDYFGRIECLGHMRSWVFRKISRLRAGA